MREKKYLRYKTATKKMNNIYIFDKFSIIRVKQVKFSMWKRMETTFVSWCRDSLSPPQDTSIHNIMGYLEWNSSSESLAGRVARENGRKKREEKKLMK